MIQVRGPWGAYWLAWWGVLLAWFWVGWFYLPHETWVLGGVWIHVAWLFPELLAGFKFYAMRPST